MKQMDEAILTAMDAWNNATVGSTERDALPAFKSALAAQGYAVEQGWQDIASAPMDGTVILGYGCCAGEISGPDTVPTMTAIQWLGGGTDYPGFHWAVTEGDAYGVWMAATHWRPLPAPPIVRTAATEG